MADTTLAVQHPDEYPTPADTGPGILLVLFFLSGSAAVYFFQHNQIGLGLFFAPWPAAFLFFLLNQQPKEWLTDNGLTLVATLLTGWLLIACGLWLLVNYVWAAGEHAAARVHSALAVNGVGLTATVSYPHVALVDAADNDLAFSFSPDIPVALPREVLTATVTLPDTLAFGVAGGPSTRSFAIPITPEQPGTRRIRVVNNGAYSGRRGLEEAITVQLCAPGGTCAAEMILPVRPEGRSGFAIRRFVNSTVNQSSPLIFLLVFIVPGLAALAQKAIDQRQAALKDQRKAEFDQLLQQFRDYLCVKDVERATEIWRKLSSKRLELFGYTDKEMAKELLDLARLDYPWPKNSVWEKWPNARIIEMGPRWPREFVFASILAQQRLVQPDLVAFYQRLRRSDDSPDIESSVIPRLSAHLDHAWAVALRIRLQEEDHLCDERDAADRERINPKSLLQQRRVVYPMPNPNYYNFSRELTTPFSMSDATSSGEIEFLRDGRAFWGHHPLLLSELQRGDRSLIIQGLAGSGRTALTHMLPYPYVNDPAELFVKLDAYPKPGDILHATADQLLRFILDQPLFLARCQQAQKEELGRFLGACLNTGTTKSEIAKRIEYFAENAERRENQLCHEQLTMFKRFVRSSDSRLEISDDLGWHDTLMEKVRALEFQHVIFVLDVGSPQSPEHLDWLYKLLDDEKFRRARINTWLFVDDQFPLRKTSGVLGMERPFRLEWDEASLRHMLEWRFEKYLDAANLLPRRERRRALDRCFADGEKGVRELLDHSRISDQYNPRRFMELWCAAAKGKLIGDLITREDLKAATELAGSTR